MQRLNKITRGMLAVSMLVVFTSLISCNKSAEDIEKEMSSGVVLIQNKSYYEAKLPNGISLYFTSYDKEDGIQGLTSYVDSVEMAISYGTGFFLSDDGKIATNHHVVADRADRTDITKSISDIIDAIKISLSEEFNEMYQNYETVDNLVEMARYDDDFTMADYWNLCDYRDALGNQLNTYQDYYAQLSSLRPENSEIIFHNELAVGYNNTFVTGDSDLHPCIFRKSDAENDLAIIQLKDKKTPADKHVFTISDTDPLEEYDMLEQLGKKMNQDKNSLVYMPAFNLGPSLALTADGLKLQLSSGGISRRTSEDIMYSIPSLPGSSGSPVLNQKGEVVAINSSGIRGSDNFNRGVRVKYLNKLLKGI